MINLGDTICPGICLFKFIFIVQIACYPAVLSELASCSPPGLFPSAKHEVNTFQNSFWESKNPLLKVYRPINLTERALQRRQGGGPYDFPFDKCIWFNNREKKCSGPTVLLTLFLKNKEGQLLLDQVNALNVCEHRRAIRIDLGRFHRWLSAEA